MKIYKQKEHALLLKPLGIRGRFHLAVTVMVFFDLGAPDAPLSEQDLWKTVPEHLGPVPVLDAGTPKPRGEVLVSGACFAPEGKPIPATSVSWRVGTLEKALHIFGNRFWQGPPGRLATISEPETFTTMDLSYANAFGGPGFAKNPTGKGMVPVPRPDGQQAIPLPNIENPRQLIGSPTDRPDPAGFGPLDMMWPQRYAKCGTYGDRWLRERWPHYPDDMNYEFFNEAPEDQFLPGFFKGDEPIEIVRMHRDLPLIRSRLPGLRIRCFATKKTRLTGWSRPEPPAGSSPDGPCPALSDTDEAVFAEIPTHIDTVRLFPAILRAVVIYRGTTEILDEEYADVVRLYVATEALSDPAKDIEHYREEQLKVANRVVVTNAAAMGDAIKEKVARAMLKFRGIPKQLAQAQQRHLGKSPLMPRTPEEMAAAGHQSLAQCQGAVDQVESVVRDLHSRFGHLMKIDLTRFDRRRESLRQMGAGIDQRLAKAQALGREMEQMRLDAAKEAAGLLKSHVDPADLQKAGVNPDALIPDGATATPWAQEAMRFVIQCRRHLEQRPAALESLRAMGFASGTVRRAWLGINPEPRAETMSAWGLAAEPDPAFIIPAGLVLPRFDGADPNRITVWTGWPEPGQGAQHQDLVPGSAADPLFIPSGAEKSAVIRVATEAEAWLLDQAVGDFCAVVVLEDPSAAPDKDAAQVIAEAPVFGIILPHKPDRPQDRSAPWQKAFANALALELPKGQSLLECHRLGIDLRQWVLDQLPPEAIWPDPSQPGKAQSLDSRLKVDAQALRQTIEAGVQAILAAKQPKLDALASIQTRVDDRIREAAIKAGEDPEAILARAKAHPAVTMTQKAEEIVARMEADRQQVRSAGQLTAEVNARFDTSIAELRKLAQDSEARYTQGMARLDGAKKEIAAAMGKLRAGELSAEIKAEFKKVGMDPERMKKRTRQQVIEMHGRGQSLAWADLSEVDLSGLDLNGADLSHTQCKKTNFSGTALEGAVFSQTMAMDADFSGASLKGARLEKSFLQRAKFSKADLTGAVFFQVLLTEADLDTAVCDTTGWQMCILRQTRLTNVRAANAKVHMCILTGADLTKADFKSAALTRSILEESSMDGADFSGAIIDATLFNGCRGAGVRFTGANLDNGRMGNQTAFPGADLRNIRMARGFFRDTDLSAAVFTGSQIEDSMLEGCNLANADMGGIGARRTGFAKSNLEGADMRRIDMMGGSLRKARLVNTDLSGANLFGVDFYKSVMGNTRLEGANTKLTLIHQREDLLP